MWLEVTNYRTDGSGRGTLELVSGGSEATQGLVKKTLDVSRSGIEWTFQPAE